MENMLCSHCKETKSTDKFWKSKSSANGFQPWCKSCLNKYEPRQTARRKHDKKPERMARRKQRSRWMYIRKHNTDKTSDELVETFRKKWDIDPPKSASGKFIGL